MITTLHGPNALGILLFFVVLPLASACLLFWTGYALGRVETSKPLAALANLALLTLGVLAVRGLL